ncbi:hypothetical protein [Desulfohalovibrio reitneri]|uniref:hypothetical protein n=1 Tax=Desulfohalovibrio reitneri TaxID=1307759 RepID=UPI0004A772B4|nr:hypothetical protein [Desulfohalovibrio reitneri]
MGRPSRPDPAAACLICGQAKTRLISSRRPARDLFRPRRVYLCSGCGWGVVHRPATRRGHLLAAAFLLPLAVFGASHIEADPRPEPSGWQVRRAVEPAWQIRRAMPVSPSSVAVNPGGNTLRLPVCPPPD